MGAQVAHARPLRSRILPALLRRAARAGIRIEPFLTVREGEFPVSLDHVDDGLSFGFLSASEIEELAGCGLSVSRAKSLRWLLDGKLCYVARHGTRPVGKMWCDLSEFNYPPNYRKLREDEAYLFAANVHPDYRGRNVAPLMRLTCYASLREMGRTKFYSYTDYFNESARRFKAKLGAQDEALRIHIELFGKWSTTLTVWRYG